MTYDTFAEAFARRCGIPYRYRNAAKVCPPTPGSFAAGPAKPPGRVAGALGGFRNTFAKPSHTFAMSDVPPRSNIHPVDRLPVLKAEIAALKREFDLLRTQLIGGADTDGLEWRAQVFPFTRCFIRLADAERLLPPEMLSQLVRTQSGTAVRLHSRKTGAAE